jgi:hypothetical protein
MQNKLLDRGVHRQACRMALKWCSCIALNQLQYDRMSPHIVRFDTTECMHARHARSSMDFLPSYQPMFNEAVSCASFK